MSAASVFCEILEVDNLADRCLCYHFALIKYEPCPPLQWGAGEENRKRLLFKRLTIIFYNIGSEVVQKISSLFLILVNIQNSFRHCLFLFRLFFHTADGCW